LKNLIYILCSSAIFAWGGQNPWISFDVPLNANNLSLSKSNISTGSKGFYQFSNPALLPMTSKIDYGVCYNKMSLDRSTNVISLNFKLPPNAGVGVSIVRSGTNNIQGKDIFNNNTHIISNHDMLGMISFGVLINKYISAGLNVKISSSSLDNIFGDDNLGEYSISNKGIGLDAGLLLQYSSLVLALKIENIKSSKSWNLNLSDGNSYDENIPLVSKFGTHYSILDNMLKFYLAGDNSLNKYSLNRIGVEISPIKKSFKIKFGLSNISTFSSTLGFDYSGKIGNKIPFKLDYGLAFGGVQEGMSHILTWTFIR